RRAPHSLPLFFFQAEDGIRDFHVTGVQTCALPISPTSPAPGVRPVRAPRVPGVRLEPESRVPEVRPTRRTPPRSAPPWADSRRARAGVAARTRTSCPAGTGRWSAAGPDDPRTACAPP